MLEDLCGRAEVVSDDRGEAEWFSLPASDIRMLVNEIMSIRSKKLLHLVPVDIFVRLLRVLDHQIHRAEGLSVDECDHVSFLFSYFGPEFLFMLCFICGTVLMLPSFLSGVFNVFRRSDVKIVIFAFYLVLSSNINLSYFCIVVHYLLFLRIILPFTN